MRPPGLVESVRDHHRSAAREPAQHLVADFYRYQKVAGRVGEWPWAEVLSATAGSPVRLVRADDDNGALDVRPVTLLGDASSAELGRRVGST